MTGIVTAVVAIGALAPDEAPTSSVTTPAPTSSVTAPSSPTTNSSAASPEPAARGDATRALATLATLPVKGRAPKTGYARAEFGQTWSDAVTVEGGRNGCDTRNDILRRDLEQVVLKPDSNGCAVLAGTLLDPYTGTTIDFRRGRDTSSAVQVDHMVALSDAWQKGAQQLTADERRNFANDPRNLQATSGPANQRKGDGDAATWLPPNRSYRCTYVARQIEVKALYRLWVTAAEHDAMSRLLSACDRHQQQPQ